MTRKAERRETRSTERRRKDTIVKAGGRAAGTSSLPGGSGHPRGHDAGDSGGTAGEDGARAVLGHLARVARPLDASEWHLIALWVLAGVGTWALSRGSSLAHVHLFAGILVAFQGVAQWLIVRTRLPSGAWWILATLLGPCATIICIGIALTFVLFARGIPASEVSGAFAALIGPIETGLGAPQGVLNLQFIALELAAAVVLASPTFGQWLFLRRHVVAAHWWPISSVGLTALAGTWAAIGGTRGLVDYIVVGALGGLVLAWLLRRRVTLPNQSMIRSDHGDSGMGRDR